MMYTLFLVLCLVTSTTSHTSDGMHSTLKEDMELEKQLNLINKPPIKSIHTKSGYIVDCVDINKQPAFDHPLLKNHKLQRKAYFGKNISETNVKTSPTKSPYAIEKVRCPKETVPIRRITKDDLISGKSLFNDHVLTQTNSLSHSTHLFLIRVAGPYYGVSGTTSVYNPNISPGQTSASYLYVENGVAGDTNKIVVGWHVSPQLYNNTATHIYSYWMSNNFKSGCYNILCSGFVQLSRKYYLGARIIPISIYGGTMTEMPITLIQEKTTKHWWLTVADELVGYFPQQLFSNLASAEQVGWGGLTVTSPGSSSPPMGSGHFPDRDFVHACYFRNISFRNESRQDYGPEVKFTRPYNDASSKCYDIDYYGNLRGEFGYALQFGGPGGYC
ncbi:protein neprosin-like [Cicer arietinum]